MAELLDQLTDGGDPCAVAMDAERPGEHVLPRRAALGRRLGVRAPGGRVYSTGPVTPSGSCSPRRAPATASRCRSGAAKPVSSEQLRARRGARHRLRPPRSAASSLRCPRGDTRPGPAGTGSRCRQHHGPRLGRPASHTPTTLGGQEVRGVPGSPTRSPPTSQYGEGPDRAERHALARHPERLAPRCPSTRTVDGDEA
ncbi:hypothetical protein HBB16_14155 [Pseudonocardia sp. MCCB 268]|nr:hypothetical protein [Pseudonocardia cytotoxica]